MILPFTTIFSLPLLGGKNKPDWNSDNKTKHLSSFDELWEGGAGGQAKKDRAVSSATGLRKSKQGLASSVNAWASVGLEVNIYYLL